MGSILLHLNDGDKTITELKELLNIKQTILEEELVQYLQILQMNNVVVYYLKDGSTYYKYVEPYGNVVCDDLLNTSTTDSKMVTKIGNFTDIVITMDSRIMKETKQVKQIHILELERKIQEFIGDEYSRSIFYQRLECLKSRYYIEDDNSIIKYIV